MIKLCDTNDCTGCGACFNICPKHCIQMRPSAEGFLYPHINEMTCIECGLCQQSCPILAGTEGYSTGAVYAAWSTDTAIRKSSSSGGLFSVLGSWVIEKGGIVFGAVFNPDMRVRHAAAHTVEGLSPMRGSKYLQSDTEDTFRQVVQALKQDQYVLYSGTPCQIAGLRSFLGKKVSDKLITVDFVCHGVPSATLFQNYLEKLAQLTHSSSEDVSTFCFRKLDGWDITPSFQKNGKSRKLSPKENIYMDLFLRSLLHREACYSCPYACTSRMGDLTIGDFWGIGQKVPFEADPRAGVSLLIVNTPQGEELIKNVRSSLFVEKRDLQEALKTNHQLQSPCRRPRRRKGIYEFFFANSIDAIHSKYIDTPYNNLRKIGGYILRKTGLK